MKRSTALGPTSVGELQAQQFCIATGTWTSLVIRRLGLDVPIEPRRGQIVLWKLNGGSIM